MFLEKGPIRNKLYGHETMLHFGPFLFYASNLRINIELTLGILSLSRFKKHIKKIVTIMKKLLTPTDKQQFYFRQLTHAALHG